MKTETCKLYGLLNFLPNVKIDPYRFKVGSFFETVYMSECRTCRKFIFFGGSYPYSSEWWCNSNSKRSKVNVTGMIL